MATRLTFRRFSSTSIANLVGANGELYVDTTKKTLVVQDGSTTGGSTLATETYVTTALAGVSLSTSVLSSYALSSTLTSYTTNANLTSTLAQYALSSTLTSYTTNANLTSTLTNYTTNANLTSTLANYTTNTNAVVSSLSVSNNTILGPVYEEFQTKTSSTGTVTHDCSLGHIFYHTSSVANWTANFTNLSLSSGYATTFTLVINQGVTGYYPSAVQIGGVAQTILWQGNTTPTPSSSRTDVVTFSILNNSGTYTVLGQLTGF